MNLEKLANQTVIHKSFGKGIICGVDEKYLEVDFTEQGKACKFPYPSCFYGFLTVEDSNLQKDIEKIVEVWKQESGVVQKEALKHQNEKIMKGIEARRLAVQERKNSYKLRDSNEDIRQNCSGFADILCYNIIFT